jgi:hypothetical protein
LSTNDSDEYKGGDAAGQSDGAIALWHGHEGVYPDILCESKATRSHHTNASGLIVYNAQSGEDR